MSQSSIKLINTANDHTIAELTLSDFSRLLDMATGVYARDRTDENALLVGRVGMFLSYLDGKQHRDDRLVEVPPGYREAERLIRMTPPEQGDCVVALEPASQRGKAMIERVTGEPVASDACIVVRVGLDVVGWGDDYGTFHPLRGYERLRDPGEALLEAFSDFLEGMVQ